MNDFVTKKSHTEASPNGAAEDLQENKDKWPTSPVRGGRIIYIAGPMTGKENMNRDTFMRAENQLRYHGHIVLNPARLPPGMSANRYLSICLAMVQQADAVSLLPGWEGSRGAQIERAYAQYQGKEIYSINDLVQSNTDGAGGGANATPKGT